MSGESSFRHHCEAEGNCPLQLQMTELYQKVDNIIRALPKITSEDLSI